MIPYAAMLDEIYRIVVHVPYWSDRLYPLALTDDIPRSGRHKTIVWSMRQIESDQSVPV